MRESIVRGRKRFHDLKRILALLILCSLILSGICVPARAAADAAAEEAETEETVEAAQTAEGAGEESEAEGQPTFEHLNYKTPHMNDAWIYRYPGSDHLIIWFPGGSSKPLIDKSLAEKLYKGKLTPKCNVLLPWKRGSGPSPKEMRELIEFACPEAKHLSIAGYSLGADRAARMVRDAPDMFERVVLISNYHQQWDKMVDQLQCETVFLVGFTESSGSGYLPWKILRKYERGWLYRVAPYKHEIGEKIWLDERFDILGWLSGETDQIYIGDAALLQEESDRRWFVKAPK